MARPTKYNDQVAQKICELIARSTMGLNHILKDNKELPSPATVYNWLNEHKEFLDRYTRARTEQADFLADEVIRVASEPLIGIKSVEKEWGTEKTTGDNVDRSKLMVHALQWKAAKLAPAKYGEKMDLTVTDIPAPIIELTTSEVGFKLTPDNEGKIK